MPDGLDLEPESPEPVDQPERLLKQLVELEPEAKPTEDVETFEVQTEVTRRASWSSLQDQLQNAFQDEGSPAPRLSKKDLKKKKKKRNFCWPGIVRTTGLSSQAKAMGKGIVLVSLSRM